MATLCGLDGPGIESQWGRDFLHPSRLALGPVLGLFPGGKPPGRAGPWTTHTPSIGEVKERIEL